MSEMVSTTSIAPDVTRPGDRLLVAMLVVAAATVVVALAGLWTYKTSPGQQRPAPEQWPTTTALTRSLDRPTLVLFAHPRCTCTRATLGALHRLVTDLPGRFHTTIVLASPPGLDDSFAGIDTVVTAHTIRGATVVRDIDDVEAERFGAATSGHVVVYDRDGTLLFRGGITSSRGHVGDSVGGEHLRTLLTATSPPPTPPRTFSAPVFGCDLQEQP